MQPRSRSYSVVQETWVEDMAVILAFGNEKIRLTVTREDTP